MIKNQAKSKEALQDLARAREAVDAAARKVESTLVLSPSTSQSPRGSSLESTWSPVRAAASKMAAVPVTAKAVAEAEAWLAETDAGQAGEAHLAETATQAFAVAADANDGLETPQDLLEFRDPDINRCWPVSCCSPLVLQLERLLSQVSCRGSFVAMVNGPALAALAEKDSNMGAKKQKPKRKLGAAQRVPPPPSQCLTGAHAHACPAPELPRLGSQVKVRSASSPRERPPPQERPPPRELTLQP
jgi:hypothetical protein